MTNSLDFTRAMFTADAHPGDPREAVKVFKQLWLEAFPDDPFEYSDSPGGLKIDPELEVRIRVSNTDTFGKLYAIEVVDIVENQVDQNGHYGHSPITYTVGVYDGKRVNLGALKEAVHDAFVHVAERHEANAKRDEQWDNWQALAASWMDKMGLLDDWVATRTRTRLSIEFHFTTQPQAEAFFLRLELGREGRRTP